VDGKWEITTTKKFADEEPVKFVYTQKNIPQAQKLGLVLCRGRRKSSRWSWIILVL